MTGNIIIETKTGELKKVQNLATANYLTRVGEAVRIIDGASYRILKAKV